MKHEELQSDIEQCAGLIKFDNPHIDEDFKRDQATIKRTLRELEEADQRLIHGAIANQDTGIDRQTRQLGVTTDDIH